MAKNRRASSVVFGFDFQVNAAIVLMLENIKELKTLKLEGNYEDIEIELLDGKYILAQAKSVQNASNDFNNVIKNLKNSLKSLSEGSEKIEVEELILITNSPNPCNIDGYATVFSLDAHRNFDTLPEDSKKKINNYLKNIEKPLDLSKFMIQILPFETDNEIERYKFVNLAIRDFIGSLDLNIPGLENDLKNVWYNDIFVNSTKSNANLKLKKSDIIWPLIVIITNVESRKNNHFVNDLDQGLYDEIVHKYRSIIDSHCERCEFFIKVLSDYNNFKCNKRMSEKPSAFAREKWKSYSNEFQVYNIEDEILEILTQIILYTIITNRYDIERIKNGVNL